jgi:8-oxo-dGTP pyrophosphatase MutT (NUDIX family)
MLPTELHEKSAGGIVYRKRWSYIEILMLAWKNARDDLEYVLPKWHMENDESPLETAIREISEETGLSEHELKVIKFMNKINYSFTATYLEGAPMIHKEVSLFLVKYTGINEPRPRKEERFVGYKWFTPLALKDIWMKPDVVGFIEKNKHFM